MRRAVSTSGARFAITGARRRAASRGASTGCFGAVMVMSAFRFEAGRIARKHRLWSAFLSLDPQVGFKIASAVPSGHDQSSGSLAPASGHDVCLFVEVMRRYLET